MKAFLIFQSIARGLEAVVSPITGVYWRTGATLTLPAWPCADDSQSHEASARNTLASLASRLTSRQSRSPKHYQCSQRQSKSYLLCFLAAAAYYRATAYILLRHCTLLSRHHCSQLHIACTRHHCSHNWSHNYNRFTQKQHARSPDPGAAHGCSYDGDGDEQPHVEGLLER